jgi:Helix-turn-helix domain
MPASWTARIEAEFAADNLTRAYRDALLALASFRGHGGEIFPSQASVAARAHCSERTVRRAIAMAVVLGLVVVLPRRRWVGGRYVRTSNRYVIGVPDRAVVPGRRPPWPRRYRTERPGTRQGRKKRGIERVAAGGGRGARPAGGAAGGDGNEGSRMSPGL